MTLIACSRMYNAAAGVKAAWDSLFGRVSAQSGIALDIIDHAPPAPLEALWRRPDAGCVFMCGWPFALAERQPRIVCAPVPKLPRYSGSPVCVTDFVVRADSGFATLEDTFGGRLAWTVENSHSGYNAVRHHLLPYRTRERPRLYRETVGPLITPRAIVEAVADGRADVGPVDGWYLDILRHNDPEAVAGLRIVATTAPAPIPPLVAHPDLPEPDLMQLRQAFLDIPHDRSLSPVLETLLIRRFAFPEPGDYGVMLDRARAAVEAGYAAPA
ncbi:MAG: PhnD/SsuA/transferrin family substrate-binding protein [Rhodospirillaceae bacterium]|nr:PhnD/SsuA/transferrin family substrate-binding protein [Rhodospirillaceae bacterium]